MAASRIVRLVPFTLSAILGPLGSPQRRATVLYRIPMLQRAVRLIMGHPEIRAPSKLRVSGSAMDAPSAEPFSC